MVKIENVLFLPFFLRGRESIPLSKATLANRLSIEGQSGRASPEPGGGERKMNMHGFWGVVMQVMYIIHVEECIISIMRGSGGNLNSLLPGVGVHVFMSRTGKGRERDAKSGCLNSLLPGWKWLELLQERDFVRLPTRG